jgi:hypothetical protein
MRKPCKHYAAVEKVAVLLQSKWVCVGKVIDVKSANPEQLL